MTCVKWYPNNDKMLLASHNNGNMYTYDVTQQCSNVSLTYQEKVGFLSTVVFIFAKLFLDTYFLLSILIVLKIIFFTIFFTASSK